MLLVMMMSLHQNGLEAENSAIVQYYEMAKKSWVEYDGKEYSFVSMRKLDACEKTINLKAKIKISMEYPIRPPLFAVSLYTAREDIDQNDSLEWCNELCAMEIEVNVHILKMLPYDQENHILAHQVRCLGMLFDYFMDEASPGERKSTSVVDVGLCKPVAGKLLAKSFRERDWRRMEANEVNESALGDEDLIPLAT